MLSSLGGGGATATAVGSPPRLNERDAVVTAVDPLSAIARRPDAVGAAVDPWLSQVKTQC
jgi:hypothetical protein